MGRVTPGWRSKISTVLDPAVFTELGRGTTNPFVLASAPGKLAISGTLKVTYVINSAAPLVRATFASRLG